MRDHNRKPERPEIKSALTSSEDPQADQVQAMLEDWAAAFLLVQQLERAASHAARPLFHAEPGMQPLIIPGRATIWPAELKPLWHLTY